MSFESGSGFWRVTAPLVAVLILASASTACIPKQTSDTATVKDATDLIEGTAKPPVFPTSNVPRDLLIKGLAYDFAVRPLDPDYWTPSKKESKCAATAIVDRLGAPRLSSLGYRVATPGASLNDVALTPKERDAIVEEFAGCVDMKEGFAALLFGDGRIRTRAASCVSQILADKGLLNEFIAAWIFGGAVDPFANNAALASALSSASQVCINSSDVNWPDVTVPDSDQGLIDSTAQPGSRSSAYAGDRPSGQGSTSTSVDGN